MALADIKKRIETDAKNEAEKILEKAEKQAKEIREKAQEEIKKTQEEYDRKLEKEKPEIFERRKIVARLDVQKMELGARRKLIDQVFDSAVEKLQKMEDAEYEQFISKLLKKALSEGKGTVIPGKEEKLITKEWLRKFNEENKTDIELSKESSPAKGGFIYRVGDVDINCTFGVLLDNLREELEAEVVKSLFSD